MIGADISVQIFEIDEDNSFEEKVSFFQQQIKKGVKICGNFYPDK